MLPSSKRLIYTSVIFSVIVFFSVLVYFLHNFLLAFVLYFQQFTLIYNYIFIFSNLMFLKNILLKLTCNLKCLKCKYFIFYFILAVINENNFYIWNLSNNNNIDLHRKWRPKSCETPEDFSIKGIFQSIMGANLC